MVLAAAPSPGILDDFHCFLLLYSFFDNERSNFLYSLFLFSPLYFSIALFTIRFTIDFTHLWFVSIHLKIRAERARNFTYFFPLLEPLKGSPPSYLVQLPMR